MEKCSRLPAVSLGSCRMPPGLAGLGRTHGSGISLFLARTGRQPHLGTASFPRGRSRRPLETSRSATRAGVPSCSSAAIRPILLLSALCLLLSLDEVAQIHEWLGKRGDALFATATRQGSPLPRTGIWMFLLGPPFLVVVALLWRAFARSLQGRDHVARLYRLGFLVFAGSALGIEIFANLVSPGGLAAVVQVCCEEVGELVGVTLMVLGHPRAARLLRHPRSGWRQPRCVKGPHSGIPREGPSSHLWRREAGTRGH